MTVVLQALPGESVLASAPVPDATLTRRPPLRLGFLITDSAIYVPVERDGLFLRERLQPRRIPLAEVRGVDLAPAPVWSAMFFLHLFLLFNALVLLAPSHIEKGEYLQAVGPPAVWAFFAAASLWAGTGRWSLTLHTNSGPVQFTPAVTDLFSSTAKAEALQRQRAFQQAYDRTRIPSTVQRAPTPSQSTA